MISRVSTLFVCIINYLKKYSPHFCFNLHWAGCIHLIFFRELNLMDIIFVRDKKMYHDSILEKKCFFSENL